MIVLAVVQLAAEPVMLATSSIPVVPLNTSLVLVASGIKVNRPVLSSNPKKPTFAALPLCQRNSIPRSLLSSVLGAVSPPNVSIGSSSVTVVLLTVVVVPFTVKLPVTAKLLLTVTVPPDALPKFMLVVEPDAPPVPMLTVLVVAFATAPVDILVVLAAVLS